MESNRGVERLRALTGSTDPFSWSADGKTIFCALKIGGIAAWDANSGKKIWSNTSTNRPLSMDFHDNIIAALYEKEVKFFDPLNGFFIKSISLDADPVKRIGVTSSSRINWSPNGDLISIDCGDHISLINYKLNKITKRLHYNNRSRESVIIRSSWHPSGSHIAAASYHAETWKSNGRYEDNFQYGAGLYDVSWSPDHHPEYFVGASAERSIIVWEAQSRRRISVLEGHNEHVLFVKFTSDKNFLLSSSRNEAIIWAVDGWKPITRFRVSNPSNIQVNINSDLIAIPNSRTIQIWKINTDELLQLAADSEAVTYTSAKIVLVGDSGVGKTGLGWRLTHENFQEHSSTHGQQFWLMQELSSRRNDGAVCEAILWDLAGQPDYRLIHALFLDDADIALLVFDPTHAEGPVQGVRFWVKQLSLSRRTTGNFIASLVAARCDRGGPRVSREELLEFAQQNNLDAVFYTSAATGEGLTDLIDWLKTAVDWENKTATVTTEIFKKIKDHVLHIKEQSSGNEQCIYSLSEIGKILSSIGLHHNRDREDINTALLHLSNHGYVALLRGSTGERRVLLQPELLNNLAASFILEARRNARGLGSLDEALLLSGGYHFAELDNLAQADRDTMLDSVITMLIQHNICFREVDPLNKSSYIVFPELINSRKPINSEIDKFEEDTSYTISGSVENVYASLVVLLGYTSMFTRTAQWRSHARYEVGEGLVCGFHLAEDRGGEQDFVLYYGSDVGNQVRNIFKGLFESFLSRHDIVVHRFDPVTCANGHRLNRAILRELTAKKVMIAHCPMCGLKINIPDTLTPTHLSEPEASDTKIQEREAKVRGKFEEALYKIKSLSSDNEKERPSVFISYAWGDANHERWVERHLARDLLRIGVDVILDRWENQKIGSSIPRFVERIGSCDKVLVVGTAKYRTKYLNNDDKGFVVAAEGDLLATRMIGSEKKKASILPILVEGTAETSFPEILQGRVYGRFGDKQQYETSFIDLAASIYEISHQHQLIVELKESFAQAF